MNLDAYAVERISKIIDCQGYCKLGKEVEPGSKRSLRI